MNHYTHLIKTENFSRDWLEGKLFPLCEDFHQFSSTSEMFHGKSLYSLFYEPSLLTRTSFERAINLLGGQAYHTEDASQFFPVSSPSFIDNVLNIIASMHIDVVVLRNSDEGVTERAMLTNSVHVINGGSRDDHPTQALADLYTIDRHLGSIDDIKVAIIGRLEHRNVNALLKGLALFKGIHVDLVPLSGQVSPEVMEYCVKKGVSFNVRKDMEVPDNVNVVYLNAPRTLSHAQLLRNRNSLNVKIDAHFMENLPEESIVMDPMQRSEDFPVEVDDDRLVFYKQSENGLVVRMATLYELLKN